MAKHNIFLLDALLEQVKIWKAQNESIVFTNGCFDILHLGHVDYLSKAASLGTKLIVAINTDASVRLLKGIHRPIQDEQSRLNIMATLEMVDAVILFSEPTPLALIESITPHFLIKGSDYDINNIVGADWVLKHGGQVKTIDFVNGYSTSNIEKRILEAHKPL